MAKDDSFLGTGWSFPPEFDRDTGTVNMVTKTEDIDQSLTILLSTSLGERVMQPKYGCNLVEFEFEPTNNSLISYLIDLVENAILIYEPRIEVLNIGITSPESFELIEGRLQINVDYKVRETNTRFNYVYDFYLREANVPITNQK
jgi:phage baseplate assembly protein W